VPDPIGKLERRSPMDRINEAITDMKSGTTIKLGLLTGA
jgi:hypothetical protein